MSTHPIAQILNRRSVTPPSPPETSAPASKYLRYDPQGITHALRVHPCWLVCDSSGRPVRRRGVGDSKTTPAHWADFATASRIAANEPELWPYIVLTDETTFTVFDVDFKPQREHETGEDHVERIARAESALDRLRKMFPARYESKSKSGNGYHIIVRGKFVGTGGKGNGEWADVEIYTRGHGIALTGHVSEGHDNPATCPGKTLQTIRDAVKGGAPPQDWGEDKPDSRSNGSEDPEWARKVIAELAFRNGRPGYHDWIKMSSAVFDGVGVETGIELLNEVWPEEVQGEYMRLASSLSWFAPWGTLNGYLSSSDIRAKNPLACLDDMTQDGKADLAKFDCTDHGNAERVHAYAGSNFRYVIESASWIVWNGSRWVPDADGGMTRLFVSAMQITGKQAFGIQDRSRSDALAKHALKSRDAAKVQAGLQMLRSILGVSVSLNDLEADPWMIGTEDGVIDLRTGRPIAPDRAKLITKKVGTRYDESAACPTWERFLHTVTAGDDELIGFLQSAAGYTLTGSNTEQCLFFLPGSGQNGKGVFSETIKRLFGDYGQVAPEFMFVNDRNQSATNHIARLAGCRLAIASELGEGTAFAESRIKSITGNDTITARFLHKEFFDFVPTHHFWISGNHKPTIQGSDHGIWRRMRLIPFTVRISEAKKDPHLIRKLADEMPGILNWALAGCLTWQREGLRTPRCVSQATEEYRSEEDIIGQFLGECIVEEPTGRVPISELYELFHRWSIKGGTKCPIRSKDFGKRLEERGFQRLASNGGRYWTGLTLTELDALI